MKFFPGAPVVAIAVAGLICSSEVAAKPLLVSGNLKKLNDKVRVAINPADGNALAVWAQGDATNNSYGRVYGTELIRQPDGSYVANAPFLISPDTGSHQRPVVRYLTKAGKYLVAWDTSYYDLSYFLTLDPVDDRPFAPADVNARTYSPTGVAGTAQGTLGTQAKLNDAAITLTAVPNIVPLTAGSLDRDIAAVREDVFITYLGSNEGGPDDQHWVVGMWGGRWGVLKDGTADITKIKNAQMSSWELIGVTSGGLFSGGKIYSAGLRMDVDENGETGRGGICLINPNSYKAERFVVTGTQDPHKKAPVPKTFGDVISLGYPPAVVTGPEGSTFTLVSHNNVDFNLMTFQSDLSTASFKKVGTVAAANTLVDQRFLTVRDNTKKTQQVYVLYHTTGQTFFYRALSSTTGAPTGGAKAAFEKITGQLKWMDAGTYGKNALVLWAQKKTKSLYEIYLNTFPIK